MKEDGQKFATIEFINNVGVGVATTCNRGGANVRFAERDSLILTNLLYTMMLCDKNMMYWETLFYKYFSIVKNYELDKDKLKLYFDNKKGYLFFTAN